MNIDSLKCFILVAENLNFARAAEAMHKSQPAVTKQINALEEELGVAFHLCVSLVGVHAERRVGRQCPGRCCPSQNVRVLAFNFKFSNSGSFLNILIALSHFVAGQRRPAPRTVRHNLVTFI